MKPILNKNKTWTSLDKNYGTFTQGDLITSRQEKSKRSKIYKNVAVFWKKILKLTENFVSTEIIERFIYNSIESLVRP